MHPVHLTCACNANYVMPLCVMLSSVAKNFSADRELVVHVICGEATPADKEKVSDSIRQARGSLEGIELRWYALDESMLERLPTGNPRFTRDSYARLFVPELLPDSCERVIYLDCDLVVVGDLTELYDSTAENPALLHATRDMGCPCVSSTGGVANYAELGIPAETPYFNSGVLVINLKLWRERGLTAKLAAYVEARGADFLFADQDVMNALLHDEWTPLDARWNQANPVLTEEVWLEHGYTRDEWLRLRDEPHIVHFTGPDKPWLGLRPFAPRRLYFFEYLAKTPFKNTAVSFPYLECLLGKRAYYLVWNAAGRLVRNFKSKPARANEPALSS